MTFKGIDFDQLVDWAQNDPIKLEAFRRTEVDKLIEQASPAAQRRLRGLQFQIDSQCKLHQSPLGRCVQISKMMHDSLYQLGAVINGSNSRDHKNQMDKNEQDRSAEILAFTTR